uniref:Protein FAM174C n=1 Tax=Geotrypetes seraphini TaxID=260995 RepID=A0A6P8RXS0_GEOSA|nr:protein FAM174C [Geotrypetes seraphini]
MAGVRCRLFVLSTAFWAAVMASDTTPGPRNESSTSLPPRQSLDNSAPVVRALYVLSGICLLALLYFIVRALRFKRPQKKKYGLLSDSDDNMEMRSEDSEEEAVFEARNLRR